MEEFNVQEVQRAFIEILKDILNDYRTQSRRQKITITLLALTNLIAIGVIVYMRFFL